MRALFRSFAEHPELAQIIASRPAPGSTAPEFLRVAIRALDEAGLDAHQTRVAHDLLAIYTTGFVQREVARRERAPGLADLIARTRASGGADDPDDDVREFDEGLEIILRGI